MKTIIWGVLIIGVCHTFISKPYVGGDYQYDDYDDENRSGQTMEYDNIVHPPPSFEHSIVNKSVKVDDDIVIECGAKDVRVTNVILWYNKTKVISQHKLVLVVDSRISIGDDYSLRINDVRATDAGQYSCTILPDNIAMRVNLEVKGKPTAVILDKDGRNISGRQVSLHQGDRIEIQCEGTGDPTPTIKWFSNGGRVRSGDNVHINNGQLIIAHADHDHAKMYQCLADNGKEDVGYASITINVLYSPIVSSHRHIVNTKEGGDAVLHCNYKSTTASKVVWLQNEAQVPINNVDKYSTSNESKEDHHESNILVIKNIEQNDLGDYICKVRNTIGEGTVKVHLGYEPEPPIFEGVKIDGDTVITHWKIHSQQPLNEVVLNYQKSGDRAWVTEKPVHSEKSKEHTGIWRIQHKISMDAGTWNVRVKAKNAVGWSLYSQEEKIVVPTSYNEDFEEDIPEVISKPSTPSAEKANERSNNDEGKPDKMNKDDNSVHATPSSEHSVVNKLVKVDDDLVIKCGTKDLSVENVILWYNQTKAISQNENVTSTDPRISIGDDYSLRINGVRATDAGQYNCAILPDNIVMQVNLEVESKPTVVILDKDGRNISGRQVSFHQGDRIEIQCEGTGNPTPTIKWFSNGERVTSGNNVHLNNGQLIIAHADHDHTKMYQCLADNGKGDADHASVSIKVLYSPIVSSHRHIVNTTVGIHYELHCNYKSTYPSEVDWFKNEAQLPTNNVDKYDTFKESKEEHHETSILVIKNIERSDLGDYRCRVRNTLGEGNVEFHLGYEPEPPKLERYDIDGETVITHWKIYSLQPLNEVMLKYQKSGDRTWVIEKPIHSEESNENSGIWRIQHNISMDAGTWNAKLKAKNTDGWSLYSQEEKIVVPTISPIVSSHRHIVNTKEGGDAVLHCNYKSTTPSEVDWFKNKELLPISNVDKYTTSTESEDEKHESSILMIKDIEPGDLGDYGCRVRNAIGEANLKIHLGYEPEPPTFERYDVEGNTVITHWKIHSLQTLNNVMLNYQKSGDRIWKVYMEEGKEHSGIWKVQHKISLDAGTWKIRVKAKNADGWSLYSQEESIVVPTVTSEPSTPSPDEGKEEYNGDDDENKSAQTKKEDNSVHTPPYFEHSVVNKLVKADDDIVIECGAKNLPDSYVIFWYNQTKLISECKFVISPDPRISIGDDFSLRINGVRATDAGQYNCTILPDNITMQVNLELEGKPTAVIVDREGRNISGRQVTYYQGDRIEIQCKGMGNPIPQIKWFSNGERVTSGNNVHINNGQLIIDRADHDHTKMYQCLADNGKGDADHASVTINVLYSPIVSSHRHIVNTKEGDDAVLHCNYKSTTATRMHWFKNEAQLPINNVDKYDTSKESKEEHHETSILVIRNIELSDLGDYVCKVRNSIGEGTVKIHLGYKPEPPIFDRVDIDGETVITYWKIHSLQPLNEVMLYYQKSDASTWSIEKPIHSGESKEHLGIWRIQHNISLVAGTWRAKLTAKNADGWSLYSQEEKIVVPRTISKPSTPSTDKAREESEDYPGENNYQYDDEDGKNESIQTKKEDYSVHTPPYFEHGVVKKLVKVDDDIVIECGAKNLLAENVISWYNQTKAISQNEYVLTADPRISISDDYSLRINGVRATDAGQYNCTIIPNDISMQVNLEVESKMTAVILDKEGRNISSRQVTYHQGDRIEIQCEGTGNPTPTIKWYSHGERVTSGNNVHINNGQLIIAHADPDHTKIYQCLADNGKDVAHASITINVLYSPMVSSHRHIVNTKVGSDAVLLCNYKSTTVSVVDWFKNENRLAINNEDKYSVSNESVMEYHESSILTIKNIERSDLGDYGCRVRNAIGEGNVKIILGYEPEPPKLERYDMDGDTVITYWKIPSLQPLNEVMLNFLKSGDINWFSQKADTIEKSKEHLGIWRIQHRSLMDAGTWHARVKAKNADGWSFYSQDEKIVVPNK